MIYVIKLKNDLNIKNLYIYISSFVKLNFNTRIIKVQLKLQGLDNQVYLIGNKHILDLDNPKIIKSYKFLMMDFYKNFTQIPHISKIKFVIFEYEEIELKK